MDVLMGLGCNGTLISKMWHFLWLALGLDVDKILRAAKAAPPPSSGGVAKSQAATSSHRASGVEGHGELDPVFSVLTLCCQATQYRIM